MWRNSQAFMSLFRAMKPVICKVHGFAVAGGSDIALCADMIVMGGRCKDWLHANASLGVSNNGNVGAPAWTRKSQTYDVHWR